VTNKALPIKKIPIKMGPGPTQDEFGNIWLLVEALHSPEQPDNRPTGSTILPGNCPSRWEPQAPLPPLGEAKHGLWGWSALVHLQSGSQTCCVAALTPPGHTELAAGCAPEALPLVSSSSGSAGPFLHALGARSPFSDHCS